ncbi:MAG TPA: DUF4258 domain-containing protein [Burkholderiales bacterium]|nr:DUF4258 domain-containing protein [Burkholderiales bacterium]
MVRLEPAIIPSPPPQVPAALRLRRISSHARVRMKQRGITQRHLELLLAYGEIQHDRHGGRIVYFDRGARRRVPEECVPADLDRCADAYAVLDRDGEVITVGHRYRRQWRW